MMDGPRRFGRSFAAFLMGVVAAIVGAIVINAAIDAVDPFIPADVPSTGQLVPGWILVAFGGMLVQGAIVGFIFSGP